VEIDASPNDLALSEQSSSSVMSFLFNQHWLIEKKPNNLLSSLSGPPATLVTFIKCWFDRISPIFRSNFSGDALLDVDRVTSRIHTVGQDDHKFWRPFGERADILRVNRWQMRSLRSLATKLLSRVKRTYH
jgi:hypothetical protein